MYVCIFCVTIDLAAKWSRSASACCSVACFISNIVSSHSASFGRRRWQVDTKKTSSTELNKHGMSLCVVWLQFHYKQLWPSFLFNFCKIRLVPFSHVLSKLKQHCIQFLTVQLQLTRYVKSELIVFSSNTASALPTSVSTTLQSTQPKLRRYSAPWASSSLSSQV